MVSRVCLFVMLIEWGYTGIDFVPCAIFNLRKSFSFAYLVLVSGTFQSTIAHALE